MKTNFLKASLEDLHKLEDLKRGRHYALPNGAKLSSQKKNELEAGESVDLTAAEAVGLADVLGWTVGQLLGTENLEN